MSPEVTSNKELVRRLAEDVWNEGKIEKVDDLLTPDFVGRGFGPEDLDRAGYKHFVSEHREIFPDLEFIVKDILGEDDRVAVRWMRSGTQEKAIMGVDPTRDQISVSGMTIYRIADDVIAEAWSVRDTVAMLQQLGIFPDQPPG